jgi:hypothetical protein
MSGGVEMEVTAGANVVVVVEVHGVVGGSRLGNVGKGVVNRGEGSLHGGGKDGVDEEKEE